MTAAIHAEAPPPSTVQTPFWMRLIPYIGMFVLALLLWLPFGFKTTGLYEEWIINDISETEQPPFFITPTSVSLATDSSRPLQMFFFAASYALDRNSHLFYNVFQMLFFFGKMVVTYWLVLQFLPGHKLLAFVAGLLYMIYPADIGPFTLRTIHIHSATLAFLLAVFLIIQFVKLTTYKRWLALFGVSFFLMASFYQYKVALVAAMITPLILLYFTRPNRRFLLGTAVWYGTLAFVTLYSFWASSQASVRTYEGAMFAGASFTLQDFEKMLEALLLGYQRQITGWSDIFAKFEFIFLYGPYLLVGLIVTAGVGSWLCYRQYREHNLATVSWQRYSLLFVAGVLFFAIGMAVYLPLPDYRFLDFRIYYLATFGSAIALAIGLYIITFVFRRYHQTVFLLFALPFVGLALLNAFEMHQRYVNFSLEQQNLLQQTVAQAPQVKDKTVIIMIDNSFDKKIDNANIFAFATVLPMALRYVYENRTLDAQYCPDMGSAHLGTSCQFAADALHITNYHYYSGVFLKTIPNLTLTYDRLLLFTYDHYGQLKLLSSEDAVTKFKTSDYDPQARIIGTTLPLRTQTLFSCVPALSCYQASPVVPQSTFDLPSSGQIGLGWRTAEIDDKSGVFRWSINPITSIDVNLTNTNDLSLDFKVLHWVEDSVINSLKLSMYNQDIPLTFEPTDDGGRLYHGIIPHSLLSRYPSRTDLLFTVDKLSVVSDTQSLGFALNWLRIRPV